MSDWINEKGIVLQGEDIPFGAWIRVYTDKDESSHTVLFNLTGKERAAAFKLSPAEFSELKQSCLTSNPDCYFQTYKAGEGVSMAVVFLTAWNVLALVGAIVCFFRQMRTLGYVLLGCAFAGMLANILFKLKFAKMKKNNGDDPKAMQKAREANKKFRSSLPHA